MIKVNLEVSSCWLGLASSIIAALCIFQLWDFFLKCIALSWKIATIRPDLNHDHILKIENTQERGWERKQQKKTFDVRSFFFFCQQRKSLHRTLMPLCGFHKQHSYWLEIDYMETVLTTRYDDKVSVWYSGTSVHEHNSFYSSGHKVNWMRTKSNFSHWTQPLNLIRFSFNHD